MLSEVGVGQCQILARKLEKYFDPDQEVVIWTSQAKRAVQTGDLISEYLKENFEVSTTSYSFLGSNSDYGINFAQFEREHDDFLGHDLIVIMHEPGIEDLTEKILGEPEEWCGIARGYLIENGRKVAEI